MYISRFKHKLYIKLKTDQLHEWSKQSISTNKLPMFTTSYWQKCEMYIGKLVHMQSAPSSLNPRFESPY
jgi:hypothetical protein